LFQIPLAFGVIITALDVFLILRCRPSASLGSRPSWSRCSGDRGVFRGADALADPDWGAVLRGFCAAHRSLCQCEMLYWRSAFWRTVMPHNLYLHSAWCRPAAMADARESARPSRLQRSIPRSAVLCLRHQRAILISRGDVSPGRRTEVAELDQAHSFCAALGSTLAPTLFASLCSVAD